LNKAHTVAFRAGGGRGRRSEVPGRKWYWWKKFRSVPLIAFVRRCLDLAIEWQASLPVAVVILVKGRGRTEKFLLFDGRLWATATAETARPAIVCWLLDNKSGKLLRQYNHLSQFPAISFKKSEIASWLKKYEDLPQSQRQSTLCQVLGLPIGSFLDPQTLTDLCKCLNSKVVRDCGGVTVVQGEDRFVCFSNGREFVVEAKTDRHLQIFFQEPVYRPVKPLRPPLNSLLPPKDTDTDNDGGGDNDDRGIAQIFQTNRSSATSVCQSGLNLAYSLGVISHQEFCSLSHQLGKTCASVALHLDDAGHLRHIFYRDPESSFGQTVACFEDSEDDKEDLCEEEAVQNTIAFWNRVWDRRNAWGVPTRAQILQPLLTRLERLSTSSNSSPFVRCLKELKKCVSLQYIVFFSTSEDQVHSVKYYLAHYACKVLRRDRGLLLKTSSDNSICALVVPGQVSLFNLQTYADAKEDAEFYGEKLWIPPPVILHKFRNLMHQPPIFLSKTDSRVGSAVKATVYSQILLRARMLVFVNLKYWIKFGQDSVSAFGVDVHGNGNAFRSASFLAFESVWTRFAHLGGPLVQGPEKMKPHYNQMLRSAARGGFMFSARKLVEANCHQRRSIMEYDLSSAYGFSASHALMPSGFCTGFLNLEENEIEPSLLQQGTSRLSPLLEKTDLVKRHKTFEFKAVYFTLRNLMSFRSDILTVFSNFAPLGLFYLDNYPADLVVVFKNGQIQVYQFDGYFVHGCDSCLPSSSSSSLPPKFVRGQTHEQVRSKTNQRDQAFINWASLINDQDPGRVEYFVVSDCHSKGYSTWSLDKAFQTDPILSELVSAYKTVSGCGGGNGRMLTLEAWQKFMKKEENNTSFTCIAWLKGSCFSDAAAHSVGNPAAQGCLITFPPPNGDSLRSGGCHLSTSVTNENVVLIRDYYQYLMSHRNFVATHLEAVLFFKTEPIFNQIYRELTERRRMSCDSNEKNWIKRLVNLSCGFFGFQSKSAVSGASGGYRNYSIRSRIPRTYNVSSHQIDVQHGFAHLSNTTYYVMSFNSFPNRRQIAVASPTNNALALFFTVVEMGKLRLVQALQFISKHIPPQNWSLLYSNVDNLIIVLEDANSLDEAVCLAASSQDYAKYLEEKPFFVASNSQEVKPGQLKLEWICNSPSWKFITGGIQHYVLREEENGGGSTSEERRQSLLQHQKTAGLNNLSNDRAFEYAYSLMSGSKTQIAVPQDRRVCKLGSMVTQRQNIIIRR